MNLIIQGQTELEKVREIAKVMFVGHHKVEGAGRKLQWDTKIESDQLVRKEMGGAQNYFFES